MKLSTQEVLKIAKLAKIKLGPKEVEKYRSQLSDILGYIGKLNQVDTSKVAPTSQVTGLENVFRDDKVNKSRSILSHKGRYFDTEVIF